MTTAHPKRRFSRYSLRTLMLVVTMFCVWMGIIANRAREQRQVVEAILEGGGEVIYEHQFGRYPNYPERPGPEWLRRLIGDEYFFSVDTVLFKGPKVNDTGLAAIERFADLKNLDLGNTQITDADLEYLKGLNMLKYLGLSRTQITDDGLEHLMWLTNLKFLSLKNTKVTDEGVKKLQLALPNCQITWP